MITIVAILVAALFVAFTVMLFIGSLGFLDSK